MTEKNGAGKSYNFYKRSVKTCVKSETLYNKTNKKTRFYDFCVMHKDFTVFYLNHGRKQKNNAI